MAEPTQIYGTTGKSESLLSEIYVNSVLIYGSDDISGLLRLRVSAGCKVEQR